MPSPLALTPRTVRLLIISVLVLAGLSVYRLVLAPLPGPYLALSGTTMGTTWEVKLASTDLDPGEMRQAGAAIESTLAEVVEQMSTWEADSELSLLNDSNSTDAIPISSALSEVLRIAQSVSRTSDGAFDVTIGPLVEAWGFGRAQPPEVEPSRAEIRSLQEHVGYDLIRVDPTTGTLRKADPITQIDVSAIAKGYGVDRVAKALEKLGHHDYLVEVGGELSARGRRLDGRVWRVAIERPKAGLRQIHRVLELNDSALATSGDYRNYYEREGRRFSHTLDPRTGRPIDHPLASVSVLHESATWADAWATALNVLGPEKGHALALEEGLAAYFIARTGSDEFEIRVTPEFERYLVPTDPSRAE